MSHSNLLDHFSVQVQVPGVGFIIGRSLVGDAIEMEEPYWDTLEELSTRVDIVRGGRSSGLSGLDVGTATVALRDIDGDDYYMGLLLPNRPISLITFPDDPVGNKVSRDLTDTRWLNYTNTRFSSTYGDVDASRQLLEIGPDGTLRHHSALQGNSLHLLGLRAMHWTSDNASAALHEFEFTPSQNVTINSLNTEPGQLFYLHNVDTDTFTVLTAPTALTAGVKYRIFTITTSGWDMNVADGRYPAISMYNSADWTLPFSIDISQWAVHLYDQSPTTFTGVIQDVNTTYTEDGYSYTTLTCVDGTSALANTTRYGAWSGWGPESYRDRIVRLSQSSPIPVELPAATVRTMPLMDRTWSRYGSIPANTTSEPVVAGNGTLKNVVKKNSGAPLGSAISNVPTLTGIYTTLTGLTVGVRYTVEIMAHVPTHPLSKGVKPYNYALAVNDVWGLSVALGNSPKSIKTTFTATSGTATLKIAARNTVSSPAFNPYVEYLHVSGAQMTTDSIPYSLQNIAYEGSMDSHLTIASDSVGALWYVSRDGEVQFTQEHSHWPFIPVFTDEEPVDEYSVSYTDISIAYDTANIVNVLDVTNHGRVDGIGPDSDNALDTTHGYEERTSVATWGRRRMGVDLSLVPSQVETRAVEILAGRSVLTKIPTSVTFRASDDLRIAGALELTQPVIVRRQGTDYACRVRQIKQTITPEEWTVTIELDLN